MARKGANKKRCEKYRLSGHKEENKRLRAERAKKLTAKFQKRREDGKTYEYKPNPYKPGTSEYNHEVIVRKEKNSNHKTEFQKWKSIFRKLDNELDRIKKEEKADQSNNERKGKQRSSPRKYDDAAED